MNKEITFGQALCIDEASRPAAESRGLNAMFFAAFASFVVSGLYFVGTLL